MVLKELQSENLAVGERFSESDFDVEDEFDQAPAGDGVEGGADHQNVTSFPGTPEPAQSAPASAVDAAAGADSPPEGVDREPAADPEESVNGYDNSKKKQSI